MSRGEPIIKKIIKQETANTTIHKLHVHAARKPWTQHKMEWGPWQQQPTHQVCNRDCSYFFSLSCRRGMVVLSHDAQPQKNIHIVDNLAMHRFMQLVFDQLMCSSQTRRSTDFMKHQRSDSIWGEWLVHSTYNQKPKKKLCMMLLLFQQGIKCVCRKSKHKHN